MRREGTSQRHPHWECQSTAFRKEVRYIGSVERNGYCYDIYIARDHSFWCFYGGLDEPYWDQRESFTGTKLSRWFWQQVRPMLEKTLDPSISPNA